MSRLPQPNSIAGRVRELLTQYGDTKTNQEVAELLGPVLHHFGTDDDTISLIPSGYVGEIRKKVFGHTQPHRTRSRYDPTKRSYRRAKYLRLRRPKRCCDAAILVLRRLGCPSVGRGDTQLLRIIAKEMGWRLNAQTPRKMLSTLAYTPGDLIPGIDYDGNTRGRIFYLPESNETQSSQSRVTR